MALARLVGMHIPAVDLVAVDAIANLPAGIGKLRGQALSIERFDRLPDGTAVHIEDFAQVFGVYPADKYRNANARSIARVLVAETGNEDIAEFVRRLVFNALIGNGDMHLKNWSLIYRDGKTAALAPAYDFVSTVGYMGDKTAGLKYKPFRPFWRIDRG